MRHYKKKSKKNQLPRCPKTGKIRHRTELDAKIILSKCGSPTSNTAREEKRVYRCGHCKGWHLTSKK